MSRPLTVMVTGASAGVGRATSIAFAQRGAAVGLLARGRAGLEAAAVRLGQSRLPGRAQPVPPIFAPEVAANAIVWASGQRRREVYVGWPTVKAIVANKIAPGVLDSYLGEHGYDSQQTDQPENPDRPHHLWTPVDDICDFGAHGRFASRTRSFSMQVMASEHRTAVAVGLLAAGALVAVGIRGAADWWSGRS